MKIAPPMPVPMMMKTLFSKSLAFPNPTSAKPAQWASFSMVTGVSKNSVKSVVISKS